MLNPILSEHFTQQLLLTRIALLALVCIALVVLYQRGAFHRFFREAVAPINLAVFRILFFGLFLIAFFLDPRGLWHLVEPWKDLPLESRQQLIFPGSLLHGLPTGDYLLITAIALWATSSFTATIGFYSRLSAGVFALTTLYLFSIPQLFGKINHYHYFFWFSTILAFSPCGDFLSVDAWLKRKSGLMTLPSKPNNLYYAIPLKTIWVLIGIIYFFPGFWKIWDTGIYWILSDNMQNNIYLKWSEMSGWRPIFRVDQYPLLLQAGAFFTILFELGWIFLILHKKTRWMAIVTGIFFHTFTYLTMNINFYFLTYCYLSMVNWEKLIEQTSRIRIPPPVYAGHIKKLPVKQIIVAGLFVGVNFIYGIFNINSWPFSIFPTFSQYVAPSYENIRYGHGTYSHQEIKSMILDYYPSERLRTLENRAIRYFLEGDTSGSVHLLNSYLSNWMQKAGNMDGVDSLQIHLAVTPLNPELRDSLISIQLITTVKKE